MSSTEGSKFILGFSAFIASFCFIRLIEWILRAGCGKRKPQTKTDGPVALSGVASGDEPKEPAPVYGGSPGPAGAETDQAWKRPLHDRIDALIPQAISADFDDPTREIADAAAVYLLAAQSLLRLHHDGAGAAGAQRTLAELHAAASLVVRDATAATASLRGFKPLHPNTPNPDEAMGDWAVSLIAAPLAFLIGVSGHPLKIVLFAFIAFPLIVAMTGVAYLLTARKAELGYKLEDIDDQGKGSVRVVSTQTSKA